MCPKVFTEGYNHGISLLRGTMALQVTIIGLGQIGGSIGMSLSKHKETLYRVGHDKEFSVEREAQRKGAVDKAEHNLPTAVRDARLVILALPVTEIRETLSFIAQDLQDGTVILDTSPVKAGVAAWAKEFLPEGCYYVGIVPALGAEFLGDKKSGLASARADLFSKSIFLVSAPPGTPGEAVELASDFIQYLDATPMLTDLIESDGFMAAAHILPQLVSTALLNATVDQPGWKDVRKMAGRAYTAGTSAIDFDKEDALKMLSLQNPSVLHAIDAMIAALRGLREDIENGNETSLKNRLSSAREGHEHWIQERTTANWVEMQRDPANYPSLTERLLGPLMGRKVKK
jgi:prephenate dehydrogenase